MTIDHQETNLPRSIQSSIEISYLLHCVLYNFLNPRIWSQRRNNKVVTDNSNRSLYNFTESWKEIMKEREIQRPFLSFPFIFREAFDPGYNYYINAIGNKIHIRRK